MAQWQLGSWGNRKPSPKWRSSIVRGSHYRCSNDLPGMACWHWARHGTLGHWAMATYASCLANSPVIAYRVFFCFGLARKTCRCQQARPASNPRMPRRIGREMKGGWLRPPACLPPRISSANATPQQQGRSVWGHRGNGRAWGGGGVEEQGASTSGSEG